MSETLSLDAVEALDQLPLDRVAYVHLVDGVERGDLYHDTQPVLEHSLDAEFDTLFDAYAREQPLRSGDASDAAERGATRTTR